MSFLRQWDVCGRLHLEPSRSIPSLVCGSLFAAPKTAEVDRVVFNRIPQNALEYHPPGYAKFSAGGHELTEIIVPPGCSRRIWLDDLNDAYPSFVATRARARKALAWTAPAEAFLRRDACLQTTCMYSDV